MMQMVYFPDEMSAAPVIRVGWLDRTVSFTTGTTDPIFIEKLLSLYQCRSNQTRGFHLCPFCKEPKFGIPLVVGGQQMKMGSAEIHLTHSSGQTFVAPDLIYHYITVHGYKPADSGPR